jgi:RNA polymerase sigma-70 factor (ECF subfamily)
LENRQPYNESELLFSLHKGNKKAFESLYNDSYIRVLYFAKRFVTDQQVAEDITTDVFLKLWDRIEEFSSIAAIKSFLQTSTRNACLNHLRNVARRSAKHKELEEILIQENQEKIAIQELTGEIYEHIYQEIDKLPPRLKKVFKLAYIDGLSNDDIAIELGINYQSVRNDKSAALKAIRKTMIDKGMIGVLIIWLLQNIARD